MRNLAGKSQDSTKRGLLWHVKWIFACYAAAFGLFLFAFTVSFPFVGVAFADWWLKPTGSLAMLVVAVAASPIIYKRLR